MRILQLCKKLPYPVKDGECLAITQLSKSLIEAGATMSLLAMDTSRHPGEIAPSLQEIYQDIQVVAVDNRVRPAAAFFNLFSIDSYHIERFVSQAFADKLTEILKKESFDVVQLETVYLTPYIDVIRKHSKAKVVLRAHNVEHEIWEGIAKHEKSPLKKWYLGHLAKKLKSYEISQLNRVDYIAAISRNDAKVFKKLGFKGRQNVVPIGVSSEDYEPNRKSFKEPIRMGFIGSLDWLPNQEGIRWFLNEIWPSLHKEFPRLEVHIAGRNAPAWLKDYGSNRVVLHGEVDCAKDFINQHSIMLVPLLSGSGMRAKILEGMALGRVVISTRLGLEGIDATHQEDVLIADTINEFQKSLSFCYTANGQLAKIGENALDLINSKYDRNKISSKLMQHYEKMVGVVHT